MDRLCSGAVIAAGLCIALTAQARAGFQIVSQTARIDSGNARFSIEFNRTPDFYRIGRFNVPAESFQYEINPSWSGRRSDLQLDFGQFADVIRGDEIHSTNKLLIRSADGSADPNPNAGGWGPVIGSVPFDLDHQVLRFSVPLRTLHDRNGVFSYRVYTTQNGATSSEVQGFVVPLPPAIYSAAAMLAVMGFSGTLMHRRSLRARAQPRLAVWSGAPER